MISFSSIIATDYYWIGGQGQWTDLNNWNTENGLIPSEVPNASNDVYFNENSFTQTGDTVFVNSINPVCKSMIWENIPFEVVFYCDSLNSELDIYGSLQLHQNTKNAFNGIIRFKSNQSGNSILLGGNQLNHDVYFDGQGGEWTLLDDLFLSLNFTDSIFRDIYLIEGTLNASGNQIVCGSIISDTQSPRTLNIENSHVILYEAIDNCWLVDAENLILHANNSAIYIQGVINGFVTKNGNNIEFGNIYLQGNFDTLQNINNHVHYDYIQVDSNYCCVTGNFDVGSLSINGQQFTLEGEPDIEYIRIVSGQMVIQEGMSIGTIISDGEIIFSGNNYINFAKLSHKCCFYGDNIFDTLIITASYGNSATNWFCFESGKTQVINDSLYIRGHPCENINIHATQFDSTAYLRKDFGDTDISCDFLIIANVAAESETLDFYSGGYSSFIPNPYDPPPGWIHDNAPDYSYGLGGAPLYEACIGDTIVIGTENFNGNDSTLYYWNFDTVPGQNYYLATESEEIYLRVVLSPGCYIDDIAVMVFDSCGSSVNEEILNSKIGLYPNPTTGLLNLQTVDLTEGIEFILNNMLGEVVFKEFLKPDSQNYNRSFDFSYLKKGFYFATIRLDNMNVLKKIILF